MAEQTELTKEQKQNVMFGCLIIGGIIYCLWAFGIKPLGVKEAELNKEMKEFKSTVGKAQILKKSQDKIDLFLAESKVELIGALSKMPPRTNPMVWSAALVRNLCQKVGIPADMRTTRGIAQSEPSSKKKKKKGPEDFFENYTVEINLTCGYHQMGQFVAELEKEIPFCHVSAIRIGNSSDFPGKVEVGLTCIFPRLSATGEKAVQGGLKL